MVSYLHDDAVASDTAIDTVALVGAIETKLAASHASRSTRCSACRPAIWTLLSSDADALRLTRFALPATSQFHRFHADVA